MIRVPETILTWMNVLVINEYFNNFDISKYAIHKK